MADFESIVDRIYEAPVSPEIWPEILHDFGGAVTGKGAILIVRRHDNWLGGLTIHQFLLTRVVGEARWPG